MKIIFVFLAVMLLVGCTENETDAEVFEGGTDMAENPTAVILTNKGEFRFELYEKRAPTTVANFIELAESGFYDGLTFHRYEPGFVIQGGDPLGTGMGG
ncbi:MAG: peptidylprolyl isomerase, partial [Candidatus Hydrothermarchaeaceae archaeon]